MGYEYLMEGSLYASNFCTTSAFISRNRDIEQKNGYIRFKRHLVGNSGRVGKGLPTLLMNLPTGDR